MNVAELDALAEKNGGRARFSVFDLPIEKQKQIAKEQGLSYEEWVAETKAFFAESEKIKEQYVKAFAELKNKQNASKINQR